MKSTFYFIYGIASTLLVISIFFNNIGFEYLDEYYIRLLMTEYKNHWNITQITTNILFSICALIWVYIQGMQAAKEIKQQQEKEEKLNEKIEEEIE